MPKSPLEIIRKAEELQNPDVLAEVVLDIEEDVEEMEVEIEQIREIAETTKKEKGEKGDKGERGDKGDKGDSGKDGKNGLNGTNGKDGLNGRNGIDGLNGVDGLNGKNGKDGSPDTGEQIVDKINSQSKKIESSKLDLSKVEKDIKELKEKPAIINNIMGGQGGASGIRDIRGGAGISVSEVNDIYTITNTQPAPDLSGYVPYTGATGDVDLGLNGLTANDLNISGQTASRIAIFDASKNVISADTATYPSLAELSYGKGVTSAIQTQLDGKQATLVSGTNIKTINGSSILGSGDLSITGTMAIGGAITSATAGSVLFAGTSGVLQQDNANFFWDDTNNRLGLGKNNPSYTLDLVSSGNIQARIGTQGSSFGYTIGRNTSTGFLDILGNQTPFSGINVDKITSAGAITIGGNAVISNWSSSLGIGNGSGSPISTIDIRSASNSVPNLSMGGGVSSNYNFRRNTTTGYLEITGVQGGFTGYKFSTGNYTDIFTLIDGVGAVFNEGGEGAIDFRVESDTDANNFFVDASANANGFGTNAPSAKVHIVKTTLQQRIGYDASNYFDTLVGSTGGVTFDAVGSGAGFTFSDPVTVNGLLTLSAQNIATDTTTGMKIGTATTQKLSVWNATPIVQPTTASGASTLVSNAGTTLTDTDTFDGYTLKQVVKAMRDFGLLA